MILRASRIGPYPLPLLGTLGALMLLAMQPIAGGAWPALGQAVMLLAVAPLLEEAVFRAGLHDGLVRSRFALSPTAAAWVTALAFAVVHAVARQDLLALTVALPALAIGAAYNRWHRLRWCVLLHAGMNALWMLLASWAARA